VLVPHPRRRRPREAINLERRALPQFAIRPNKSATLFYYSVYGRKPNPVPFPCSFVVKNAQKYALGSPHPFRCRCPKPRANVSSGFYDRMRGFVHAVEFFIRCFDKSFPPLASRRAAFTARFMMICSIWLTSARMVPRSGEVCKTSSTSSQSGEESVCPFLRRLNSD